MARRRIADFMQTHRFWLVDLVPSIARPFYVLGSPFLGFSSISTPEYTADVDEIKQVNSMYKKYAYAGGSVSPITLSRGVRGWDDSMWEWMRRSINGLEVQHRHLLLIHYSNIGMLSQIDDEDRRLAGIVANATAAASFAAAPTSFLDGALFLPGKAWLLWGCLPTRYKAGTDFDALSGDVSIAELDIQPEAFTEFSLLSTL